MMIRLCEEASAVAKAMADKAGTRRRRTERKSIDGRRRDTYTTGIEPYNYDLLGR